MRSRNRRFSLWLDDKEFTHLTKQADKAGMKKEPFIRKLIMGAEIRPRPPDEYLRLIREVNAIGNNINQIAHIANAEQRISSDKIAEVINLQNELIRAVRSVR